jgi:TPR repeat protein
MACCGQTICGGCAHSSVLINKKKKKKSYSCAFCRYETPKDQEDKVTIANYRDRAEKNDAKAINALAKKYRKGECGLPKDEVMALRLNLRAAQLGSIGSIICLASHFNDRGDAPHDPAFAMQLVTIAAKRGNLNSYGILACIHYKLGDVENAVKSWIFAARAGNSDCMELLRTYEKDGAKLVSDDDLEAIEGAYKEAVKLEWSEEREVYRKLSRK